MTKQKPTLHSWQSLREEYGMTQKVFKRAIASIQDELDEATGGLKKYKYLNPKQVKMIREFLGTPE